MLAISSLDPLPFLNPALTSGSLVHIQLKAKNLYHLHSQTSLGQSCHSGKNFFSPMHVGSLKSCPTLCNPVNSGLPGFSVRRVLQARILECTGQNWLPYHSRTLYFLLPSPQAPLSTWCCQNPCNPISCTTSTRGPHGGSPKCSRAASGANPNGWPTCRGRNKTTIETQGHCV